MLIQLGAIMAILTVYSARLWHLAVTLPKHRETQRFVAGVLLAFLPAAVIGALAHDFIKTVLFETPMVICVMLIIGGFVLLWVDRRHVEPKYTHVAEFPLSVCLKIGFIQCLAMIPGTSRSGATIVGALLMGADKRSAAEFSFFLAMPTMVGAFAYDLYKNRDILTVDDFWHHRRGLRHRLHRGRLRRALPARFRGQARLHALRHLAARRRHGRPRRRCSSSADQPLAETMRGFGRSRFRARLGCSP